MVSSVGIMEKVNASGFSHSASALLIRVNEKKMVKRQVIANKEILRLCMISPFLVLPDLKRSV
jgi:hypothetical protein